MISREKTEAISSMEDYLFSIYYLPTPDPLWYHVEWQRPVKFHCLCKA